MILVLILAVAVYATLLVRYLALRSHAADAGTPAPPRYPGAVLLRGQRSRRPGRIGVDGAR
jgi:hypothetical protein